MIILYLDHTSKWSGGEIALWRSLLALDKERFEPVVALAGDGPFAERLRAAGVETHIFPLGERVREIRKDSLGAAGMLRQVGSGGGSYLRYIASLARFMRQRRADIVHCNSLKSDIYGAAAAKISRRPALWHVRDHIDPTYLPGPAVNAFRRLARRVPAAIVVNSESTKRTLFPGGKEHRLCRVVYDGLSESELSAPLPEPSRSWRHSPPRIGLLGRIAPWKGQHVFLDAASALTGAGVEAEYRIIGATLFGEDEYEARIRAQAVALGNRVVFTGFRDDVAQALSELDILVHASTSPEPFGQVVVEGMANGLPVIASDGGGVQEIIADQKTGILTPMGDAAALAKQLKSLLADPARASELGRAAHQAVRTRFTAQRSARGLESIYEELRDAHRHRP